MIYLVIETMEYQSATGLVSLESFQPQLGYRAAALLVRDLRQDEAPRVFIALMH